MNTPNDCQTDRDIVSAPPTARAADATQCDDLGPARPASARVRRHPMLPIALGCLAAALLTAGAVPRLRASTELTRQVQAQSALTVSLVEPKPAPASQELLLPGAVTPYIDASIYARTSGYIAHWYTDIGTKVKAGQTLAVIETPELDAQLSQARADEATALANYNYAKSTADRWQQMLQTQSVSQQDADTKTADMQAKKAMLEAARANVARLAELVSYERVGAPFDGTITARNIDIGSLVTAGGTPGVNAPANGTALFQMAQTATLRVFVDVPQDDAARVDARTPVYLTSPQYPGRRFPATVARTTNAIDPSSRTLRVEVDVDNADGALLPGAYAQAHLGLVEPHPALELPVSALLFRPKGVTVAVVGRDGKAHLKTVTIGRDFGTYVEVATGLAPTDRVIDNPGDAIGEGEAVRVAATPAAHA
ncbi:efflux transporter periplasmic adaptor subunit [Trinickia symbiotica]|uniref:Efflux transporter periplasmic adaptor subunit n=1 Tax=Trinickia symbiotica TaxID=863227 RepID=A0A2T3XWT9_9BURK|nr:efflux RND transporter periplasmic adaptor subunit [Trinickia symbiotica]PTB20962.1 efflux transporter periplasmic adaptor subunit [Trinickia symbiotica]